LRSLLNWIVEKQMIDVFPNVYIMLRIFVTIPIVNCEAERSFSVLKKRIKNMYRTVMLDERLTSLTGLAIESELIIGQFDFDNLGSSGKRRVDVADGSRHPGTDKESPVLSGTYSGMQKMTDTLYHGNIRPYILLIINEV
ncbi:hypothetical protein ALC62_07779, partial [Cyphomyrmex costatus]